VIPFHRTSRQVYIFLMRNLYFCILRTCRLECPFCHPPQPNPMYRWCRNPLASQAARHFRAALTVELKRIMRRIRSTVFCFIKQCTVSCTIKKITRFYSLLMTHSEHGFVKWKSYIAICVPLLLHNQKNMYVNFLNKMIF